MNRRSFLRAAAMGAAGLAGWAYAGPRGRAGIDLEQLLAGSMCRSTRGPVLPASAHAPGDVLAFAGTRLFKEGFLDDLARAYTAVSGRPSRILGGGCDDGVSAVIRGEAHVGGVCCPLPGSPAESLQALLVGYDLKVVVAHPSQKVGGVTKRDLISIMTGSIANWRELGGADRPIALVVHDHCPNYVEPVRQALLGNKPRWSKRALFVKTDQKHLETVARFESSLGINSWILAEPLVQRGELKVLSLDGVSPSTGDGVDERYPLRGPMSMLFQRWRSDIMGPFFEYLYGPEGRRIIGRRLVPVSAPSGGLPRPLQS